MKSREEKEAREWVAGVPKIGCPGCKVFVPVGNPKLTIPKGKEKSE